VLSLAPYVPWGEFLSASIKGSGSLNRQKVVIDNDPIYKAAAGKPVNVNDLNTFPPNSRWAITYPTSGDSTLDAQNADTFTKFELIRIPTELGGDKKDASSFVGFSKVCVHLWCSPNYNPQQTTNSKENGYVAPPAGSTHQKYECPCHGSQYRLPDGQAVAGPAALQPAPANAIPILTLSSDSSGQLFIEPPKSTKFDNVNSNGVLGLGRTLYQGGGTVNEYKFADGTSANTT
jgi:ubiquinol-cytochrome c reductase iron-sulfur subunit